MKLYYSPGACSLAPHIALYEAKLDFETEKVNLSTKITEHGTDYLKISPKGYVPTLVLDDNTVLTEVAVILQLIADRAVEKNLFPSYGHPARYSALEWLNFIATEIHKGFSPFFKKNVPAEYLTSVLEQLGKRLTVVSNQLSKQEFLLGTFSIADPYLFTVLRWSGNLGIDLEPWPPLTPYLKRVAERPGVQAALKAEGLVL